MEAEEERILEIEAEEDRILLEGPYGMLAIDDQAEDVEDTWDKLEFAFSRQNHKMLWLRRMEPWAEL